MLPMYVDIIPNRKSKPTILIRECWSEGGKTVKETRANITHLPEDLINVIILYFKEGRSLAPIDEIFAVERSIPHGHVEAILAMIKNIGLGTVIASKPCWQRDYIVAMIAQRIIDPGSELATSRMFGTTTLGQELGIKEGNSDKLYKALYWLAKHQGIIERKLAKSYLGEDSLALYDLTSSYYEGRTCSLAQYGHDRDCKKGLPIIVYGVTTNRNGCPVGVDVFPGNTADAKTLPEQVRKLRHKFGIERIVLVGDRGLLASTNIENILKREGIGWISALRSEGLRGLADDGYIQPSLFDERNLAEITSPDFPGERLIVCFNPFHADERKRDRESLLAATQKNLIKLQKEVSRRTRKPMSAEDIAVKYGKIIQRHKMEKHIIREIADGKFTWKINEESVRREEELDGIYVIRTSEPKEKLSAEDAVRNYKRLSQVEQAFRTLKGIDLKVRPIFHRREDAVRGHIFLCMLAYHVEWHMRKALAPLLYDDEELDILRDKRDPVAPAKASASAKRKKATHRTPDGLPVHSFHTLMKELSTRCRNICKTKNTKAELKINILTELTPIQKRAMELIKLHPVAGS